MSGKKITNSELHSLLVKGPVHFSYIKKDGSLRNANGTLDRSIIPSANLPKGGNPPANTLPYYDLDSLWWRTISDGQDIFLND